MKRRHRSSLHLILQNALKANALSDLLVPLKLRSGQKVWFCKTDHFPVLSEHKLIWPNDTVTLSCWKNEKKNVVTRPKLFTET